MKDPFGRGIIAGLAGVIAINILEFFLQLLGISETQLWEAGGIIFLSESALQTPLGIAIGVFSHVFVALVVAVGISYFLLLSGGDFSVLKGIGISLIAGFITLILVFPLRGLATEMQDSPGDVFSALLDHIVFGALVAYIIKYLHNKNKPSDNTIKKLHITPGSKMRLKKKQFIKPKRI